MRTTPYEDVTIHRLATDRWACKGRPCRRTPDRNGYCPSHQHLAGDLLPAEIAA